MKKILILSDRFYPEEFVFNDLAVELSSRGLNMEVLTQQPSYPSGRITTFVNYRNKFFSKESWNGIIIRRIFTILGYKNNVFLKILHYLSFTAVCSFVLLVKGKYYDTILVTQSGPLIQAIPAVISKLFYHNRILIWSVDLWPDAVYAYGFKKNKLLVTILNKLVKWIYTNMDIILISSSGFGDRIKQYSGSVPVYFLPQWADVKENVKNDLILDRSVVNFTFAGNIGTSQNLEGIILGFIKARDKYPNMILNIFGDGNNVDNVKKLISDNINNSIIFWGRKPQSEIFNILKQSDILIISLRPDPLFELYIPLKFSTYLTVGKPLFGVISGEVAKLIDEYQLGITSNPGNIEDIAYGFNRCTDLSSQEKERFAQNSKALSNELFNREQIIQSFFAHINNTIIKTKRVDIS